MIELIFELYDQQYILWIAIIVIVFIALPVYKRMRNILLDLVLAFVLFLAYVRVIDLLKRDYDVDIDGVSEFGIYLVIGLVLLTIRRTRRIALYMLTYLLALFIFVIYFYLGG